MRTALQDTWPEQQIVHRMFTMRWTHGFVYTRVHGAADDDMTRWQIDAWSRQLEAVIPQLGGEFVSVIDTTAIGEIPRSLWFALMQLSAGMSRRPNRRALLSAEGWAGDNHAEAAQLVTAGGVRVFRPVQTEAMITWLSQVGTIDHYRLHQLLG